MKKIIAFALVAMLALSVCCGCDRIPGLTTPNGETVTNNDNSADTNVILTIGDYEIDEDAYKYFFKTIQKDYMLNGEDVDFSSVEFKEQFNEEIESYFKSNAATYNYAKPIGVDVDNIDQSKIDEVTQYYTQIFSLYYGVDINDIYGDQLPEMMRIVAINDEISLVEMNKITDEEIDEYITDNYASAKHILIGTTDEEGNTLEGDALEAKKALANDVYNKAIAGEDFDALIKEYGEDPGMEANPDGYTFGPGEMVEEFYQGTLSLEDNAISNPVETTYGYHIIKRLPLALTAEEIAENRDTYAYAIMEADGKVAEIQSEIQALIDTTPVIYGEGYNEITFDTFMAELEAEIAAEKAAAEAEAEAEVETEAEVEVEAEAETESAE